MTNEIKKAFVDAEKELQEKEIAYLKSIVKELLEKKDVKEKKKRDIEKEISIIKQTIDDFKAGRLDKVKELQEKDEVAKRILPFKEIIIINQPIITQPWHWTYQIVPNWYGNGTISISANSGLTACTYAGSALTTYTSANGAATAGNCTYTCSGIGASTFTGGTYPLGSGKIINL